MYYYVVIINNLLVKFYNKELIFLFEEVRGRVLCGGERIGLCSIRNI